MLISWFILSILFAGCGNNNYKADIEKGSFNGVQLGFTVEQVKNVLGKPDKQENNSNGSILLLYKDITYAFHKDTQKLTVIVSHSKNKELCGIKVGMPLNEVKKRLGNPDAELPGNNTSEYNGWVVHYSMKGENCLAISSRSKNDPVSQVVLITDRYQE